MIFHRVEYDNLFIKNVFSSSWFNLLCLLDNILGAHSPDYKNCLMLDQCSNLFLIKIICMNFNTYEYLLQFLHKIFIFARSELISDKRVRLGFLKRWISIVRICRSFFDFLDKHFSSCWALRHAGHAGHTLAPSATLQPLI